MAGDFLAYAPGQNAASQAAKRRSTPIGTFTNTADHGRGGDQNGGDARVLAQPSCDYL